MNPCDFASFDPALQARSGSVAFLLLVACLAFFAWAAYSGVRREDRSDGEPREPQRFRRGWSE